MVCVDRLIASTCFEPGNGMVVSSNNDVASAPTSGSCGGSGLIGRRVLGSGGFGNIQTQEIDLVEEGEGCSKKKKKEKESRECRICQEEGEESDMEAPCACNGTLKFAHRMCIQKWCNKKGNITCEICNQVYAPNYSVSLCRNLSDDLILDIRYAVKHCPEHKNDFVSSMLLIISHAEIDLQDPRLLALTSAEQELLNAEIDGYSTAHSNGIACCRSVALILILLLLIRHAFDVTVEATILEDASTLLDVPFLQLAVILLPCYIIIRLCFLVQSRRQRQAYSRQTLGIR